MVVGKTKKTTFQAVNMFQKTGVRCLFLANLLIGFLTASCDPLRDLEWDDEDFPHPWGKKERPDVGEENDFDRRIRS